MEMIFAALALFGAVWAATLAVRAEGIETTAFSDAPNQLPPPGARDLHPVTPGTLGRVRVPRWT